MEDFDNFMDRVNEVDATIKGLASGDIAPEAVSVVEDKVQEIKRRGEEKKQKEKDKFDAERAEKKAEEDKKKQYIEDNYDDLMAKVERMKAEREAKEDARKKFSKWRAKHAKKQGVSTDYTGWDLWEPDEDPEDDPLYKDMPPPDTPELRAFEKDITMRAEKRRERDRLAEQEKENGNRAFRAKQYSEARKCYDTAIGYKKDSRALFVNRAFAHVKLGNWASAIEDCDKAVYIGEIFEHDPKDTLTVKAFMRRAMAHSGRMQFEAAIEDLDGALDMDPTNKAVKKLLKQAKVDLGEQQKENRVKEQEATRCAASADAAGGDAASPTWRATRSCARGL